MNGAILFARGLRHDRNKEDIGVKNFDLNKWKVKTTQLYNKITGNDYVYLGGEFHPDIKMVHFTHATNKPHDWEDYRDFV